MLINAPAYSCPNTAGRVQGGHTYTFFKIPIPVVWASAEDAVYFDDGKFVSLYWHDGLYAPPEPQTGLCYVVEVTRWTRVCRDTCIFMHDRDNEYQHTTISHMRDVQMHAYSGKARQYARIGDNPETAARDRS
jgi:hypothetical protein